MSSLSKKVKEKVRLEMSKEMKLEAVFEDDEDECRKTADFVNRSLWNFLNVAEENGFNRYLMLTTMYIHAAGGIYYGTGKSTEAVRAEIVEELDGFFELIDNGSKSAKSIH